MTGRAGLILQQCSAAAAAEQIPELAALLRAVVHAGGSVHFTAPLPLERAERFWREKVLPGVAAGARVLWTARIGPALAGTVQLDLDMPPNQPHRAEVSKLLVHPDHRRHGIGRALMAALEAEAAARDRSLLTLDTRTGDHAERLYAAAGFQSAGVVPEFAYDPLDRRLVAATYMFKRLRAGPAAAPPDGRDESAAASDAIVPGSQGLDSGSPKRTHRRRASS